MAIDGKKADDLKAQRVGRQQVLKRLQRSTPRMLRVSAAKVIRALRGE